MADDERYLRSLERSFAPRMYGRVVRSMGKGQAGGGLRVTVTLAGGQSAVVNTGPINFTVTFNQPATGFTNADVSFTGSTATGTLAAAVTGSGPGYNVAVSGMTGNGNVVVSIPAASATDVLGKPFPASNTVLVIYDTSAPLQVTGLTATVVGAAPAIASLAFQGAVVETGSATSRTLAFTAASAAGQERLLAITGISSAYSTTTFGSVAIAGQAATQVGAYVRAADANPASSNGPVVSFWRAPGTSATSFNVTFNISAGSMFDVRGVLWSLNNGGTLLTSTAVAVDHPAPTTGVPGGATSLSVNTASDGVVAAAVMSYDSTVLKSATWSGLTERLDGLNVYGSDFVTAADLNAGAASTPLTITCTLPTDYSTVTSAIAALAVSFNHA